MIENADTDLEKILACIYGNGKFIDEEIIFNEIKAIVHLIDFSKIRTFECNLAPNHTWLDLSMYNKHHSVFEFMLGKYHEFNPNILNEIKKGIKSPYIHVLLSKSIFIHNYDFIELCLRYIDDINVINYDGMSFIQYAKDYADCDEHIIELLEMHSIS